MDRVGPIPPRRSFACTFFGPILLTTYQCTPYYLLRTTTFHSHPSYYVPVHLLLLASHRRRIRPSTSKMHWDHWTSFFLHRRCYMCKCVSHSLSTMHDAIDLCSLHQRCIRALHLIESLIRKMHWYVVRRMGPPSVHRDMHLWCKCLSRCTEGAKKMEEEDVQHVTWGASFESKIR